MTAGESHGECNMAILEGLPSGLAIEKAYIDNELSKRQSGYGRSIRSISFRDTVKILSGVRDGYTTGAPVALMIENVGVNDEWRNVMAIEADEPEKAPRENGFFVPRPGHADLAGHLKYGHNDLRDVCERASARETSARVAAGALAKKLLKELGVEVFSFVTKIGNVEWCYEEDFDAGVVADIEKSDVRCPDRKISSHMIDRIDEATKKKDSLGGVFEIRVCNIAPGLGSYSEWDTRIDGLLAQAIMSIPSVKGVEIGCGFRGTDSFGSEVLDEIFFEEGMITRHSNNAGGIEGGITNGMPIVMRVAVKPVPTIMNPLRSVDLLSGKPSLAHVERADVCVVPACSVIAEAMVSLVIADEILVKFGTDKMSILKEAVRSNGK